MRDEVNREGVTTSIKLWLSVRNSAEAVEFYKKAFGATEVFSLDTGDNMIARLAIDGAEFWVGPASAEHFNFSPDLLGGSTVRVILTVSDPDAVFERALSAGASRIYGMVDEHGWRIGRVVDPYGHHWEIGRPTDPE